MEKSLYPCFLLLAGALAAAEEGKVVRIDPAFDRIAPQDAKIEFVAGGFAFTEGPVWLRQGFLLFSDIPNNKIVKWTPESGISEFAKPAPSAGQEAITGPNGITFDRQGRLIVCEQIGRKLTRIERDGKMTILADRFEGKRLNSPNDVVVKTDGSIYFTDPPYGLKGQDKDPAKELPFNGVYRLKDGRLEVLYKELTRPNGIAFSPNGQTLYVANSDGQKKIWMRFDVQRDGKLANPSVFADVTKETAPGGPDGMKVDTKGNVYGTGPGGIWVLSPDGKHLGTISPPEVPANCGWGDPDGKTLYMTARKSLYRIRLNIPGLRP